MPEKPKRRKNKNKRKNNKNFSTDVNKNHVEESKAVDESCSSSIVTENITNENVTKDKDVASDSAASCQTSNTIDEFIKSESSQIELVKETNLAILSSSQTNKEFDKEPSTDSFKSENNTELTEGILNSLETNVVLSEINKNITAIEKVDNSLPLLEQCAKSQSSLSDINTISEPTEDVLPNYIVETPEQVTTSKTKSKLDNTKKSKSCDNDDCTTIVEITDDVNVQSDDHSLSVTNNSNAVISGDELDIEWENVRHFNLPQAQLIQGILSSDTIPLNIVHCDEIKSLSPQEEQSLRNYLHTLNLSTSPLNPNVGDIKTELEQIINREIKYRLRKKGLTEDLSLIRAGPSRSLAVIDEEGSGDSSKTSRRHSYLSDKKSDSEELEDDVFECKPTDTPRTGNKHFIANIPNKRLIPQPCIRVDAKLKEPEISEARGDWSVKTIEKMTGAELVYLTDSSSSTSSVYDLNDEADKGEETDVSVRMITPTIEVTDTESLLSNTFLSNNNAQYKCESLENKVETESVRNLVKSNTDKLVDTKIVHDTHEIVILSTDNIKTNLIVKDINEQEQDSSTEPNKVSKDNCLIFNNNSEETTASSLNLSKDTDIYDLEIKVLKCELNNAINNLIKEVISDSETSKETSNDTIPRQDSSSSLDSSQCTAKYNPTHSSLNDVANIFQEDNFDSTTKDNRQTDAESSHVKDVLQSLTDKQSLVDKKIDYGYCKQPSKLKDLCIMRISSFPFGDKIIEELAEVSLRLQNISALATESNQITKQIHNSTVHINSQKKIEQNELRKSSEYKEQSNIPPPILPRKSSLKMVQDDPIKHMPLKPVTKYECLSPSHKMLMEKTNTTIEREFKSQPNININATQENKLNLPNIRTPIAPMKSETGSRLLALLRDTSMSNNLNSQTLEENNLNSISNRKLHSETFSKRLLDEIDSAKQYKETTINKKSVSTTTSSSSFKPLPPPKPKKLTAYLYESDEGSDFRGNSLRSMHSNKKYFHYSTGNLNKEIEDDISSIQNMHRYCTNKRDQKDESSPRRPSLPKDLCDQQMEYIRQKEKEVDAELRRLEQEPSKPRNRGGPRAPMVSDGKCNFSRTFNSQSKSFIDKDSSSQTHKICNNSKLSSLFSSSQEELLREKMYSEYVNQMAEREHRKQHKVIKVTQTPVSNSGIISKSMPLLENYLDSKMNNRIEEEFISKARERWCKLGIRDPDTAAKSDVSSDLYREPKVIEHKIKVIEAGEEKDVQNLPSHMQEFVKFTVKEQERDTGRSGESKAEPASAHVVVFCAVIILVLTVGKFLLQLLRNK